MNMQEEPCSPEVRRELKQFLRDGAKLFAPKVEYDLVSSDGTVIDTYTVEAV